jgi:DNA-binding NarL/FixJ family response regulator
MEYNLTAREKEVLTCIVNGLSHKMIAAELNISYETVRSHTKNIYKKLNVASLTETVAKALNQNIVALVSRSTY